MDYVYILMFVFLKSNFSRITCNKRVFTMDFIFECIVYTPLHKNVTMYTQCGVVGAVVYNEIFSQQKKNVPWWSSAWSLCNFYCSCYICVERYATTSTSLLVSLTGNFLQFTARQFHTNWQIKHTYLDTAHTHTHPTCTTFEHFSLMSEAFWHAHSREWYKGKIWLDFPTKLEKKW